jgi:ribosomal protein L3
MAATGQWQRFDLSAINPKISTQRSTGQRRQHLSKVMFTRPLYGNMAANQQSAYNKTIFTSGRIITSGPYMLALDIQDLRKTYKNKVEALRGVSLQVQRGDFVDTG